ncbi:unnamed protein product [Paramecium sonneborni]|uniref:Cyclin-like domain-containing protein n=1 Tax=Paramecium sonneborni TaxID=65129 RepID=A0A8S1QEL2_9CILI|nr:unnamed protein product [Paramecium sonneborni]
MKQDRNLSRSRRSPSPQLKIKKAHRGKQKKNRHSQSSSFKTNSQSHEKQPHFPEEGKLLNFIKELEAEKEKQVFSLKLSHFHLEDVQSILTINDDMNHSQMRRQQQYSQYYHQEFQQSLINENVYLGNCLLHQKISQSLRAKMIDWMIEVLGNYSETTSDATFFRSVSIMDYYLQKSITSYSDNHLHLIGITSMFIATKIEDIYHIPLSDFVTRVSHNKYTASKIKAMEQSILETLNFEITFPTTLDFLHNIFYQCFSLNDNPNIQNILETSTYILKMCLHDYSMTSFNSYTLASSSFIYSIADYIKQNYSQNQDLIINQFNNKIVQISQIELIELNLCQNKLEDLINTFKIKYPELHNLDRFS